MLVIGIDPGIATTGYGLVEEDERGEYIFIAHGVILTPAKDPLPTRLEKIYNDLHDIVNQFHPDCSAVERIFFQRNVKTAINVGQARGVILLTLAQSNLQVSDYTPLEIKQAVVGYGGAEKKQVQSMVKSILDLDNIPKPDDAADALAIAICHLSFARYKSLTNQ